MELTCCIIVSKTGNSFIISLLANFGFLHLHKNSWFRDFSMQCHSHNKFEPNKNLNDHQFINMMTNILIN